MPFVSCSCHSILSFLERPYYDCYYKEGRVTYLPLSQFTDRWWAKMKINIFFFRRFNLFFFQQSQSLNIITLFLVAMSRLVNLGVDMYSTLSPSSKNTHEVFFSNKDKVKLFLGTEKHNKTKINFKESQGYCPL